MRKKTLFVWYSKQARTMTSPNDNLQYREVPRLRGGEF